jgi:hypothetical protein
MFRQKELKGQRPQRWHRLRSFLCYSHLRRGWLLEPLSLFHDSLLFLDKSLEFISSTHLTAGPKAVYPCSPLTTTSVSICPPTIIVNYHYTY